jgi:hypothetical protein
MTETADGARPCGGARFSLFGADARTLEVSDAMMPDASS